MLETSSNMLEKFEAQLELRREHVRDFRANMLELERPYFCSTVLLS